MKHFWNEIKKKKMKIKMFFKVKEKSLLVEMMFHFLKKNVVKAYLIKFPFKSDCDK